MAWPVFPRPPRRGSRSAIVLAALAALAVTSCRGQDAATARKPAARAAAAQTTYIREFQHPRVVVHYHPRAGQQFTLAAAQYALDHGAHALELDLHMRGTDVVCNHDGPTPEAPRLVDVLNLIVRHEGKNSTVYNDNRQFFVVLEPKDNDALLLDSVYDILGRYLPHLSTAVGPNDPPRGITVVITGGQIGRMHDRFAADLSALNRRCLLEGHNYRGEIRSLTLGVPFQWTTFRHPDEMGHVNALHAGTDPAQRGKYNIRVWGEGDDQMSVLTAGVDSVNCDHEQVVPFTESVRHQDARGAFPALALRGRAALMAWRGASSNNLYVALGTSDASGLSFPRQISLSGFLTEKPQAVTPAAAILPDGRILVVYEGTNEHRLWYVCGQFTSADRFLTFDGGQHRLTPADDSTTRGSRPAVAVAPDGRAVIVYEAADGSGLKYVAGKVDRDGNIAGTEQALAIGRTPRAEMPAIAIDPEGHLLLAYRCKDDGAIRYIDGKLDASGHIAGSEYSAALSDEGNGSAPAVATNGRSIVIAYEGAGGKTLRCLWGTRDSQGHLRAQVLPAQGMPEGAHPATALDSNGRVQILFESGAGFGCLSGKPDAAMSVTWTGRPLDIGMDPL